MVVEGSRQVTMYPGFVLLGTRQQGVLVILRQLMLPDEFNPVTHMTLITTQLSINCKYISVLQEVSRLSDSLAVTYLTLKLGDTGSNLSQSTSSLKIMDKLNQCFCG
ncbi:unnamed protein product [Schistosoma guineensis]|nr:unnamed protein product [Schistosoma guineensis]